MWRVINKPINGRVLFGNKHAVICSLKRLNNGTSHSLSNWTKSVFLHQINKKALSINVLYDMQRRCFSTAASGELREITNNSKLLLLLQSGEYEELMQEIKKKYEEGYYLSKNDFSTIIHRFTEFDRYLLTNELYSILKDSKSSMILEHAPLFCYNYLLSGEIQKAFSLISHSSDEYLAMKKDKQAALPQEYLFVRLCIQLMSDIYNLDTRMDAFSQSLPRRSKSMDFTTYSQGIVNCYVYSWKYLITCIKQKQGVFDESPSQLKEFFASPYTPIAGDSRSLSSKSFSSFTMRYADQRLQSTLRSLELLLWFYYSRSVFDMSVVNQEKWGETYSFAETIDGIYDMMKGEFDFWNKGIFHFFIFHFSQPVSIKTASKMQIQMKSEAVVCELLEEMKKREWVISPSLMKMLLSKKDMSTSSLQLLMSFYINKTQSPVQLHSFIQSHGDLLIAYTASLAKRNAQKEFEQFVDELFYINARLPDAILNELVLTACYLGDHKTKQKLVEKSIHLSREAICGCIIEGVLNENDISSYLSQIDNDPKWKILLQHVLITMNLQKKNTSEGKKVFDFCNERGIGCCYQELYQFYRENCDYQSILQLFSYVKREHIVLEKTLFKEIERVVNSVLESKSRFFGSTPLLNVGTLQEDVVQLPRANSKYSLEKTTPLQQSLAILRQDESAVSVNVLIESTVKEYCKNSILNYGLWICRICNKHVLN